MAVGTMASMMTTIDLFVTSQIFHIDLSSSMSINGLCLASKGRHCPLAALEAAARSAHVSPFSHWPTACLPAGLPVSGPVAFRRWWVTLLNIKCTKSYAGNIKNDKIEYSRPTRDQCARCPLEAAIEQRWCLKWTHNNLALSTYYIQGHYSFT